MGLTELLSNFFLPQSISPFQKKKFILLRRELKHGAKNSNLLKIKEIQMNKTMQNRFGGVPTAQNGNTRTRFFRKPFTALLMLLVFLGAGGKAWGQVTYHHTIHWSGPQEGNGGTPELVWDGQIAFFDGVNNGGWCNVMIYLDGDITLKKPILVWQGQTICFVANNGNRTIFRSIDVNKSMFYAGGSANGVSDNRGTLIMDGGTYTITIDGEDNDTNAHVIHVQTTSAYNNSINKVTFQNCKSYQDGPVIQVNGGGKLTCSNCTFIDNEAKYYQPFSGSNGRGGVVNNSGFFYCTSNCTFQGNSAPGWAGAIYNAGVMELTDCTFRSNTAAIGGAIDIAHASNFTSKLDQCEFYENIATSTNTAVTSTGGAINIENANGSLICTKVTFGDGTSANANQARDYGGAVYNNGSTVTFQGCDFNYNICTGTGGGGAIGNTGNITCQDYTSGGSTTHCTFTENTAHSGGGIWNDETGTATCTNCVFNNNDVPAAKGSFGGGIFNNENATLSCTGCSFSNNDAFVGGGVCSYGKVTVTNCTFTSNTASGSGGGNGGGLYQANSSTSNPSVVTSCEFSGNKANAGGAIFSSGYLRITEAGSAQTLIHHNEINSGGTGGGGIFTNGIVDMEAGKIYSNATNIPNGGGVYVAVITYSGDFRLKGSSAIYSNTATGYGGGVYVVSGATFTMSGSSNIGASGGNSATLGGGIYSEGTVTINGGQIVKNTTTTSGNGGGAYVADGTFTLSSGNIGASGNANTANKGGGVYVAGGTFNLSGGNVQYNTNSGSDKHGAGIYLASGTVSMTGGSVIANTGASLGGGAYVAGGTFTLSSGNIGASGSANSANKGGGVYVADGTFNLSGGNVQYNTTSGSNNYGSGIYLASGSVSMTGGKVNNNTGATQGGGVYVAGGTFGLSSNGEIISNSAGAGGGVYQAGGTFNQSGGYIGKENYGNTATSQGGAGLYLNSGTFNLSSIGNIAYNTASAGPGGGVRLAGGTLAMSGGQIVNNTASGTGGGGVFKGTGDNTILRVTGTPVIKYNEFSGRKDDVFLNNATANNRHILIGDAGLQCGAEIGVFKNIAGDYYKIAEAEGSNAAANANYAMRNGFFFDDASTPKAVCSKTSSPWYDLSSSTLYFASPSSTAWDQANMPASGYSVSGSGSNRRVTISTAQGLAYFAHQVNTNTDNYEGATVELTADVNLSGKTWVPIGYMTECDRDPSAPEGFKGTFDGKGHTIYNVTCDHPFYDNAGLFGIVRGGTVKNLMVSGTITNASANLGGIVGEMIDGSVYNCMSSVTPSGGSNRGALVGKITSGSVKNCYAISDAAAAGNGTVTNCYVRKASGGTSANMGTATNVGSGTTGTFTATQTPYLYKHADNRVGSTPLLTLLNQWVDDQNSPTDLAHWSRTMASPINGDYPILMMPGMTCVGTKSGSDVLNYGSSLNTMLGSHHSSGDNIYFWGTEGTVASPMTASNTNANVYFAENAAIIHSGSITNAHVGITLDNTNGSAGVHWHMFSPALSKAPLGINYTDNTDWPFSLGHPSGMPYYLFNQKSESSATYGYFPSHEYNTTYPSSNASATSYYPDWDYYCYYEPEYHWINFKRNGNSHHHEDLDPSHPHINYQATPSAAANQNESTLIPGKGYLVATAQPTLLEAKGTLNQGNIPIAVTKDSPTYRTGFNFLGNPYQSYFDFDEFADVNKALWGGTKTNASYIILDKDGYTYYAYSGSANLITSSANRYLHPHQGFMIVATNAGTASFTNAMRSTTGADFRDEQVNYPLVNLIVTEDDGNRDITTIELGRPEVGGAFKYYDLRIGKGCLYTHYEDQDYAIAFTLPGIDQVGVRFETDEDATYTMTWDMENGEFSYLHLIDNITGSDIDCLQAREYRFSSKTTDFKSRFKLMFGYTGVEENEDPSTGSGTEGSGTFAFIMGNELVVNCGPSTPSTGSGTSGTATLQMFDMTGRQVMSTTVSGTQTTTMLPNVTAGVYVLRLSDRINGTRTQKIVIE